MERQEFIAATIDRVAKSWNIATSEIKLMGYATPTQKWSSAGYLGVRLLYTSIDDTQCRKDGVHYKNEEISMPEMPLYCVSEKFMGCESINRAGLELRHIFKESQERNVVCLIEERGATDVKVWLMPDLAKWREEERARDAERIAKFAAS